jgi:diketogulonate reductase-like aldo/keto reductase
LLEDVGSAIAESHVDRDDVFIITKLHEDNHGYRTVKEAFKRSLELLRTNYVDLFLVHSPFGEKIVETWDGILELQAEGHIKSVGVSNFGIQHLEALRQHGRRMPAVNQIELHPLNYLQRRELLDYCKKHLIQVQAYGSLFSGKKKFLRRQEVQNVAGAHRGKTAAQVLLRWGYQLGVQLIPKSTREQRMKENLDIFNFHLTPTEMKTLEQMEGRLDVYWNPVDEAPVHIGDPSKRRIEL